MTKQPAARLANAGFAVGLSLIVLCVARGCGESNRPPANGVKAPASSRQAGEVTPTTASSDEPGCVKPTAETIESGTYTPLSRPLFVYVNKKSLEKPHVAAFLRYYLHEGQVHVNKVQSVKLPEKILEESQRAFDELAPKAAAEALSGTIQIDGSSTVYLISQAIAEEFENLQKEVHVEVGKSGTGGGFKKFGMGNLDINDASRPIVEKEIALCKEHGVEYASFTVAIDGISVVVSTENTWCNCLTVDQLKKAWEPDSKVLKWSDLNPLWPEKEIRFYGADTDSGTFDFFTEAIVGKAKASRSDYTASGDDNILVTGVQENPASLGYIPFAYYVENQSRLKALGIVPHEKPAPESKP